MSRVEIDRVSVIQRVVERRLTAVDAAQQLGLTNRHVGRLVRAYRNNGPDGLVSKRRGKRSNRAFPDHFKQQVLGIVRDRYADFGPTLVAEKLLEKHEISLADETVRRWLTEAGIWCSRRAQRQRAYQPRYRRDCFGELIQIDGSEHAWFEDRGPKACLLVFIDDATSKLVELRFCELLYPVPPSRRTAKGHLTNASTDTRTLRANGVDVRLPHDTSVRLRTEDPALLSMMREADLPSDEADRRRLADGLPIFVGTAFLTKSGDALLNPKITLTWLMQLLGAHPAAIALLVPLRESLSMLPQILLAPAVDRRERMSRLFSLGCALQAIAVFAMAAIAFTMEGVAAGWLLVLAVIGFSLARCLCSLVSKAVMAKVIPKGLRGQTNGWAASAAGLATVLVGIGLLWLGGDARSVRIAAGLLVAAGALWVVAALWYTRLDEPRGTPGSGRPSSFRGRLSLFRADPDFTRFVITRALLLSSALVAPYYLLLGTSGGDGLRVLAGLLLASGIASLVSGPFWGRYSDTSSRRVLVAASLVVTALGAFTVGVVQLRPSWLDGGWLLPLLYFVLEIAHQGIRLGRKTYIVDLADDDERVDYVSLSNSAIGVLLLVTGLLTSAMTLVLSPAMMIATLSLMTCAGAVLAHRLPEIET